MSFGAPSVLEAAIVKTMAWFSLFDYPMTAFEIWKWLGIKASLAEVEAALRESVWLRGRLVFQDGLFVLGGRSAEVVVALHQERFLDAARKFKKLGRAARFFSLFPFVRAVFACNNLAWRNTMPESDIDLFIVVSPGTIWLSRLLLVLPFALLKKRPFRHLITPQRSRARLCREPFNHPTASDPFCFSFFITADNLSLEKICLPEGDPYMAYWLASLVLIFDRDDIQKQVWGENEWVSKFLPNIDWDRKATIVVILSPPLIKPFEKLTKFFQLKFLPKTIKVSANLDSRVIVSDTILKFHLNDRRAHFREEWNKLYEALGAG